MALPPHHLLWLLTGCSAFRRCDRAHLCSSMGEMLGALEEAFADAATADAAYPSPGGRAADGTELDDFDMDLDVRGGTGSSNR